MAQCLLRARSTVFPKGSPTLPFLRYKHAGAVARVAPPAQKPRPSMLVMAKTNNESVMGGDIGLLPDTFIMPTGANLPSLFSQPGVRFALIKNRIKQRLMDLRDMAVFRFATKNKLRLWEPKKVALSLHKDMYTAFARGDLDTLRLICGEGLLRSFRKRIAARGNTRMEWKLHRMLSRPKIVSSKAHHYMGLNLNKRQTVVRIHSLQSLAKFTPQGELVEGSDQQREIVEYIVVEKNYPLGKEGPWHIWGTTEETTLERFIEQKRKNAENAKMSLQ